MDIADEKSIKGFLTTPFANMGILSFLVYYSTNDSCTFTPFHTFQTTLTHHCVISPSTGVYTW